MDFKFGVLLFIGAHICCTSALPPCVCTRNLRPVCGSDGKTYANECLLDCENYKTNAGITVARKGMCEPLPKGNSFDSCICPLLYLPVCGNDGQTYASKCNLNCHKLRSASLELRHEGACEGDSPLVIPGAEPPCTCPRSEKPVCGSDGNTYSNDCLLNCATKDNSQLKISHPGPCIDEVKVVE